MESGSGGGAGGGAGSGSGGVEGRVEGVLRLRGAAEGEAAEAQPGRVTFAAGVKDNEFSGGKVSSCCCIYTKPRAWDESSSSSDEECQTADCRGHVELRSSAPNAPNVPAPAPKPCPCGHVPAPPRSKKPKPNNPCPNHPNGPPNKS